MKNIFLTLSLNLLFLGSILSQSISPISLFNDGLQTTFTKYNELGNVKNIIKSTHSNIIRSGSSVSVNSATSFCDANSTVLLNRDFGYKLVTNSLANSQTFFIDMKYFLPLSSAIQYKNYNVTATGNAYEVPSQLSSGMILNSVRINYNFTPNVSGLSTATTTVSFMNRTVVIREKVSTMAGLYMCWKITEDCEIRNNKVTKLKVTRWVNPDIGLVKTEVRDTSGNLIETDILTRFQTPTLSNGK